LRQPFAQARITTDGALLSSAVLIYMRKLLLAEASMPRQSTITLVLVAVLALQIAFGATAAAADYRNFSEAYSKGVRLLKEKKVAESQEPLEAALKLATDDDQRKNTYQALTSAYRQLPEIDKMLEAQDFIIRHSERHAGRSNAARSVVSFLFQRGKLDVAIERYEAELQKNADDPAAITILTELFAAHRKDAELAATYQERREKLDRELAEQLAKRLEKDAQAKPETASWDLKEAAHAWLEAGEKDKALAAAKLSAAGRPERRSEILSFFWHEGLGQAFQEAGDPKAAILQYELAIPLAPSQIHIDQINKRLALAKKAAAAP